MSLIATHQITKTYLARLYFWPMPGKNDWSKKYEQTST